MNSSFLQPVSDHAQAIDIPNNTADVPRHWQLVRLGDAFRFTQKPRGLRYDAYAQIPFVPMEYIPLGETLFTQFSLKRPSEIGSGTYFESGDILLAKITPSFENEKQGIIESLPTSFGVATTEVIPIQQVAGVSDKHYLFYYLLRRDVRVELAAKMEGSTGRQRLSKSVLENLTIPLPPLAEQRAIACSLQAVQDAIAARRRELALERERKAALMQHLFTHGTRGEPRKQTEIGEMPEGWQPVSLKAVLLETQYGLSLRGEPTGPYPILRMNNLVEGRVDIENLQYVELDPVALRKFKLNDGDILFNRTNSYDLVGKTALFAEQDDFVFASYLIRLVADKTRILPSYLNLYLNWRPSQQRLKMLASRGVSQSNISASKLIGFNIPLPSVEEQWAIVTVLEACNGKITALEHEIALHKELFQAMLEELMTGRLSTLPLVEGEPARRAAEAAGEYRHETI